VCIAICGPAVLLQIYTSLTSSLAALGHLEVAMLLEELLAVPCYFGGAISRLHIY
jgi:hypothetical protein